MCQIFIATKPNGTGGDNKDDEYHGRRGGEAFECFRVHQ
jgi:hypothetical protein